MRTPASIHQAEPSRLCKRKGFGDFIASSNSQCLDPGVWMLTGWVALGVLRDSLGPRAVIVRCPGGFPKSRTMQWDEWEEEWDLETRGAIML